MFAIEVSGAGFGFIDLGSVFLSNSAALGLQTGPSLLLHFERGRGRRVETLPVQQGRRRLSELRAYTQKKRRWRRRPGSEEWGRIMGSFFFSGAANEMGGTHSRFVRGRQADTEDSPLGCTDGDDGDATIFFG